MNTCSVSINRSIPDSSKVETKAKNNKPEDNFKDMIKNVSSNTSTSPKKDKQVGKEDKSPEDLKVPNTQGEDTVESKDEGVNTNGLATLLVNPSGVIDAVQLKKVVTLSAEGQIEGTPFVNEQKGIAKPEAVATNTTPSADLMQGGPVAKGAAEAQESQKAPLVNVPQTLVEGESVTKPVVMAKQEATGHPLESQQNGTTQSKQEISTGNESKASMVPLETEGMENSSVTTAQLKLMQANGTNENMITVKVGEPSLNDTWKQVAEEIGNMIVEKVNNEVQKVNITLNPKDLGEIDVEFFINKGKIAVSLTCSNEATKALLATNMDSLSKVVQSSLMQDVNVNLTHDKADGQNTNSENFDGRGNNGHYQEDSQSKKKNQEQPDLDFVQRLRLGIESIEGAEV